MSASGFPVLASLSMLMHSEDESSDDCSSSMPICIKNTFIDVVDDFNAPSLARRSASAPSTPRGHDSCNSFPYDTSPFLMRSSTALSLASTSTGPTECDDEEDADDGHALENVGVPLALFDLLPHPEPPLRTKLSTRARAWTPCRGEGSMAVLPPEVKSQFAEITSVAQTALMKCASVQQAGTFQSGTEWTLEACCQSDFLAHAQPSIELVKLALLRAAEQSKKVYIIGYETQPFKPLSAGLGFSTQLALVDDELTACWDLLRLGCCHRGCSCRWNHPTWKMSLNVILK